MKVQGRPYLPAILLAAALVGAARGVAFDPDGAAPLSEYHGVEDMSVAGWVADDPDPAGRAVRFRFRVEEVSGSIEGGDVLVTMESADVRYGDRLLLTGALEEPPAFEGFDYAAFLARRGIGSVMSFPEAEVLDGKGGSPLSRALTGLRTALADSTERVVPEPQAAFGQAVLLGIRDRAAVQAGRRLQGDRRLPSARHIGAARRHPARAEPDGEPVAAGTAQEPLPDRAAAAALAVRSRRRHVPVGDAGGDNGQRVRCRHGVGAAPRHPPVAGAGRGGDGSLRPEGALERLVPASASPPWPGSRYLRSRLGPC